MNYQDIILRANHFFQTYNELAFKQHRMRDLNFAQVQTLVLIAQRPHLTLVDISKERQISRSAVTQLIKKLEHKGYVKRISRDGRGFQLILTKAGQTIYQEHQEQHELLNDRLIELLSRYPNSFYQMLTQLMTQVEEVWEELPTKKGE